MASYEDFKKIDLRIAKILSVNEHPNADKLYVLEVEVGEEKKQVIAGIRLNYTKEELLGKKVVVVNNLDPAVIRGEQSNGMILAASGEQGPIVLFPEKDVPSGSVVK